ncbi:MAG: hypothetical protein WCF65_09130 [Parachlamydiaceae bacterium]
MEPLPSNNSSGIPSKSQGPIGFLDNLSILNQNLSILNHKVENEEKSALKRLERDLPPVHSDHSASQNPPPDSVSQSITHVIAPVEPHRLPLEVKLTAEADSSKSTVIQSVEKYLIEKNINLLEPEKSVLIDFISQLSSTPHHIQRLCRIIFSETKPHERQTLFTDILGNVNPQMLDIEKVVVAIKKLNSIEEDLAPLTPLEQRQLNRSMTVELAKAIQEKLLSKLTPESIIAHAFIQNDGIGDLMHLITFSEKVSPVFGDKIHFIASYLEQENLIKKVLEYKNCTMIEPALIDRDDMKPLISISTRPKLLVNVSLVLSRITLPLPGDPSNTKVARASLLEIKLPEMDDPKNIGLPPNRMGLDQAGIWFFPERDPEQGLKSASKELKTKLGCEDLTDSSLKSWHDESILHSAMVYGEVNVDRSIFASLAIMQATKAEKKRAIFKVSRPPDFLKYGSISTKIAQQLQSLGVGTIYYNGKQVLRLKAGTTELRIIAERLEDEDWAVYQDLTNGSIAVGGDRTLSEAMQPGLPPMIFSQHAHKTPAYYRIVDLARELSDTLTIPGMSGLIRYFEAGRALGHWADPIDYAHCLAKIVAETGETELRHAWGEFVKYARQEANLNDFVTPLLTEQALFALSPEMKEVRQGIMGDSSLTNEEKTKKYFTLAQEHLSQLPSSS